MSPSEGILVGCDCNQEWLLSWWWDHYAKHNSYPVAFADFGMSPKALKWCREKGEILKLSFFPLKKVPKEKKIQWEKRAGEGIWPFRAALFKKPSAFLASPFPLSCWIDLDCEIKGNLEPLFNFLVLADIAIAREPDPVQKQDREQGLNFPDESTYNSGVVPFRQGSRVLKQWIDLCEQKNHLFLNDQSALSRAIYLTKPPLIELPQLYNWKMDLGPNPNALIHHYAYSSKLELVRLVNDYK